MAAASVSNEDILYKTLVHYGFKAQGFEQISVAPGEIISVLGEADGGWTLGLKEDGSIGYYPTAYALKIDDETKEEEGDKDDESDGDNEPSGQKQQAAPPQQAAAAAAAAGLESLKEQPLWVRQQRKVFTAWINSKVSSLGEKVTKLEEDIADGVVLAALLHVVAGASLKCQHTTVRVRQLDNMNAVFSQLHKIHINPVNIAAPDIVDKNIKLILGLSWTLVHKFQLEAIAREAEGGKAGGAGGKVDVKNALLKWVQQQTAGYKGVNVTNFDTSFKDGLALCALLHAADASVLDFASCSAANPRDNLQKAFDAAKTRFGVAQLLEPEDFEGVGSPDERCVMTYVGMLWGAMGKKTEDKPNPVPEMSTLHVEAPTDVRAALTDENPHAREGTIVDVNSSATMNPAVISFGADQVSAHTVRQFDVDDVVDEDTVASLPKHANSQRHSAAPLTTLSVHERHDVVSRRLSTTRPVTLPPPLPVQQHQTSAALKKRPGDAGIGMLIEHMKLPDGRDILRVAKVVVGSPARKDGRIKKGDILLSVDGENVMGMSTSDVKEMIRGVAGTVCVVTVQHKREIREARIVRANYVLPPGSKPARPHRPK